MRLIRVLSYVGIGIACLGIGIGIGGYLFIHTQPRTFLTFSNCEKSCIKTNELLGLLTSIGIEHTPRLIPDIVLETDRSIAIENPVPQAPIHFVVFPKRDIKNPGDLSEEDKEYLADVYAVIAKLVKDNGLSKYKILTNGPGYQDITYLHFHLIAPKQ